MTEWLNFILANGMWGVMALVVSAFLFIWYRMNKRAFFPSDSEKQRGDADVVWRREIITERKFEQIYLNILGYVLDWVAAHLTKDKQHLASQPGQSGNWRCRWFGVDPFTDGSYQFTLRLAIVYPLFAYFTIWVFSGGGSIGGMHWLPDIPAWQRLLSVVSLVFSCVGFWKAIKTDGWTSLLWLVFAGAAAFAVVLFWNWLDDRTNTTFTRWHYWLLFNLFYLTALFAALYLLAAHISKPEAFLLLLFLILLPLVNALLDWLSLGITRGLLHAIRSGHHGGWLAILWGMIDLLLAVFFLFIISALTAMLVALVNAVLVAGGGQALLDLTALFDGLATHPLAAEYRWIHFMLLSTLIPTLIHFLIASLAFVLFLPRKFRAWMVDNLDTRNDARIAAVWYLTLMPVLALAGPGLFIYGAYWAISANGAAIGMELLHVARFLAAWIDPTLAV